MDTMDNDKQFGEPAQINQNQYEIYYRQFYFSNPYTINGNSEINITKMNKEGYLLLHQYGPIFIPETNKKKRKLIKTGSIDNNSNYNSKETCIIRKKKYAGDWSYHYFIFVKPVGGTEYFLRYVSYGYAPAFSCDDFIHFDSDLLNIQKKQVPLLNEQQYFLGDFENVWSPIMNKTMIKHSIILMVKLLNSYYNINNDSFYTDCIKVIGDNSFIENKIYFYIIDIDRDIGQTANVGTHALASTAATVAALPTTLIPPLAIGAAIGVDYFMQSNSDIKNMNSYKNELNSLFLKYNKTLTFNENNVNGGRKKRSRYTNKKKSLRRRRGLKRRDKTKRKLYYNGHTYILSPTVVPVSAIVSVVERLKKMNTRKNNKGKSKTNKKRNPK